MSKSDFEFYEIEGISGEFVIPKVPNDPYRGHVHPQNAGQLAIDLVSAAIEAEVHTAPDISISPANLEGNYFFKPVVGQPNVVQQRVEFVVDLEPEKSSYYSRPLNEVWRWLSTGRVLPLPPFEDEQVRSETDDILRLVREGEAVEAQTALFDLDDQPTDPTLLTRQVVPVRAYQWLPGPIRKSPLLGIFSPAHNVRPVPVVIAQEVVITGLNPHVNR